MPTQLRPADLQIFIDTHKIQAELIANIGDTPTVPEAAAALGVAAARIIKTLLFLIKVPGDNQAPPRPVIVISNGESRVDKKALGRHFEVGTKKVKLASAQEVADLLGYPAGGVPPFGHHTSLPVILDAAIEPLAQTEGGIIFGGGGDDRTMLKLTVGELLRVTQPEILAVS